MNEFILDDIIQEEGVTYTTLSPMNRIAISRKGISKKSLLKIVEWSAISIKDFAKLLPISLRTIQRYDDEDLLDPHVSERVLLIGEVFEKGMEVFNSREKLHTWLHSPLLALGHQSPLDLLDTGFGVRLVMDTLGRIEHGVFS
ncbi:MAG: antitoxin Xre/MbcA/ParS toxin-binding domain-containing protein [Balneolaceae bacterium]